MPSEHDHRHHKFLGMYLGRVVSNEDPKKLARVRVYIPGVSPVQGTAWALPLGFGGGQAEHGIRWPVKVGTECAVWFHMGDVDHPYYLPTNQGTNELPAEVQESTPAEATKVRVQETDRWRLTIDERDGKQQFQIKDKTSDDVIEIDGVNFGVRIKGTAMVYIESETSVDVVSPFIQLGGRQVIQNGKPIS